MIEFMVNKFITLRLEEGETNIYINDKLFNQCKFVIVSKNVEEIEVLSYIMSVDDLLEISESSFEPEKMNIPIEARFWAHCSNLQTWAENNYDTRLLHSNLSFPLLKELYLVGDISAKRVFKEEIAKRLKTGSYFVQKYLFLEGYKSYLTPDEIISGVLNTDEAEALIEISRVTYQNYEMIPSFDEDEFRHKQSPFQFFSVSNGNVIELELVINGFNPYIPKVIKKLKNLKSLNIYINSTDEHKLDFNVSLPSLKHLEITTLGNVLIPNSFESFPNLTSLKIKNLLNGTVVFDQIPETLGCLKGLSKLDFRGISLPHLPNSIGNLKMLDQLTIKNTGLKKLPATIFNLEYLGSIELEGNPLKVTSKIKELVNKFEKKIYNIIRERTIEGTYTTVKDLRAAFNVPEYKIYNIISKLTTSSSIKCVDTTKESYIANLKKKKNN